MISKKLHVLIGVCFSVVLLSACAGEKSAPSTVEFFLSPDGNDNNPGTVKRPFRTLEKARAAVRASADRGKKPIVVWLQGGRYFRTETFVLCGQDSGTRDAPVAYRAVEGGEVFLDGGRVVPSSSCKLVEDPSVLKRLVPEAREQVLQIDLKTLGITDYGTLGPRGFARAYRPAPLELFINGEPLGISRWPNTDQIPLGKVIDSGSIPRTGDYSFRGGIFEYGTNRVERWTQAEDPYISGLFFYGYADDTIPIEKIDTAAGTIKTTDPHLYGFGNKSFTKWYALNLIEEIDIPGEYCVDKRSGILYFTPPRDIAKALIQVSLMEEPLVAMEGASYIRFENLVFENSRSSGVYIERGNNCMVAGCTLRNLGTVGVQIGKGIHPFPDGKFDMHTETSVEATPESRAIGSYLNYLYINTVWNREGGTGHTILSCDIFNTGAGGIILGGGDRKTLTPAGNTVENCDIHHVTRLDRLYRACINIDGVGNRIRHCRLHDAIGQAVLLHGNDHLIELNRIHHVLTDQSDMGAIYMGRDPSEAGHVFRYNFFHDIFNFHEGGHGVQAIFFDDESIWSANVFGNVFLRAGSNGTIKFNGGGLTPIANNIFIDCPPPSVGCVDNTERVHKFMQSELGQRRLRSAVDILGPLYSNRYPPLKEVYEGRTSVTNIFLRNYVVNGDYSEFENQAEMNFKLKANSKVFDEIKGFEPIPFEKIGLKTDRYRTEETRRIQ